MTRTSKTAITTVTASGAGEHVATANPTHDHDNAATDAAIQAAIDKHVADKHGTVTPPVDPPPIPPPTTVTVTTIADLYAALTADKPDITLAPGTYSGGIYFDSRFAARTVPGVVHCDGVTMNGGGLTFRGGAHDLDVQGITFANNSINQTGVLMFGGWDEPAAHHITVRKAKILASVHRTLEANTSEHGVYFSIAQGGVHDVLIEDLDVTATNAMGLATAIHADHGDATQTAHDITIRRTVFRGNGTQGSSVQYPLILWVPPYRNWLFDGATISNANGSAIRVQSTTSTNIVFKDIVSTGSRYGGLYGGTAPAGVTFQNCSLQ